MIGRAMAVAGIAAIVAGCGYLSPGSEPSRPPEASTTTVTPSIPASTKPSPAISTHESGFAEPTATALACGASNIGELNPAYEPHPFPALYPAIRDLGTELKGFGELQNAGFDDAQVPKLVPNDEPLQLVLFDPAGEAMATSGFRAYYADKPIGESDTIVTLVGEGGVMLHEYGALGDGDYQSIRNEVGDSVVEVGVGPYPAALIWAPPSDQQGHRYFLVRWSDGKIDFEVIGGVVEADGLIDFVRSIYC